MKAGVVVLLIIMAVLVVMSIARPPGTRVDEGVRTPPCAVVAYDRHLLAANRLLLQPEGGGPPTLLLVDRDQGYPLPPGQGVVITYTQYVHTWSGEAYYVELERVEYLPPRR
jgi:hypothetical protein